MMENIRVLIVYDHPVYRFGLRALISSVLNMEVVGEATNGESAVELATNLQPDIILMDINIPGLNGIQATRQIVKTQPGISILVITMFDDDSVFDAMQAGARGYILKGADPEETIRANPVRCQWSCHLQPKGSRTIDYIFQQAE